MTAREKRVVDAFVECVRCGRFEAAYVTVLLEDDQRYGWMSETAKDAVYAAIENLEEDPAEDLEALEELESEPYLGDADLDDGEYE